MRSSGIENTSHHTATLTNDAFGRRGGVGEAERLRTENPREVEQQQHAAAEIAERIARRRHAVGLFGPRDVREQRVVEDGRARHADVADEEEQSTPALQSPRSMSTMRGRRRDADQHEDGKQAAS